VNEKVKLYGIMITMSLALIGSLSVIGILQSSERVNTSGIIIQPLPPENPPYIPPSYPPPSPPPEPVMEIDVYCDPSCTTRLESVDWGEIEVGGTIDVTIYVKNSGDDNIFLFLSTENWDPVGAEGPISLSWDHNGNSINPGMSREITLTLSVSSALANIDNFNFDIIITGSLI